MKEQVFRIGYLRDKSRVSGGGSSGIAKTNIIDVTELPEGYWNSTAVPNSGTVETVYFNQNLTEEEMLSMLSGLTYQNGAYVLLSVGQEAGPTSTETETITGAATFMVMAQNDNILGIVDNAGQQILWVSTAGIDFFRVDAPGWQTSTNAYVINAEVNSEYNGLSVGTENEKIKDLFSSTPFEYIELDIDTKSIYRLTKTVQKEGTWVGTTVPNSGTVETVYFNTELSKEKITELLSKLTYITDSSLGTNINVLLSDENNRPILAVFKDQDDMGNDYYVIGNIPEDWNYWWGDYYYSDGRVEQGMWDFPGNPVFLNITASPTVQGYGSSYDSGSENDLLSELISITPFVYVEGEALGTVQSLWGYNKGWINMSENDPDGIAMSGTTLPNDGEIGNVYFNKDLSPEEILSILGSLEFTNSGALGGDVSVLLTDSNGNAVILVVKEADSFVLMVNGQMMYGIKFDLSEYQWNPEASDYIEFNGTAVPSISSGYDELPSGANNELVKNLVSSTPFVYVDVIAPEVITKPVANINTSVWDNQNGWEKLQNAKILGPVSDDGKTFLGPYAATDVIIPEGVEVISEQCFEYFGLLENVQLPNSLKAILDDAFNCCGSIKQIALPDNLTYIGARCFSECYNLQSIKIPAGITTIEPETFLDCESLTLVDMTVLDAVPTLVNTNAFSNIPDTCKFKIKADLFNSFVSATNWSTYANNFYDENGNKLEQEIT